jgi:D-arabinose 1-dehydrogenase-like Zn-dependent alcohol dehydrogenase
LRQQLWQRLATGFNLQHIDLIGKSILFSQLPEIFSKMLRGEVRGRIVIDFGMESTV